MTGELPLPGTIDGFQDLETLARSRHHAVVTKFDTILQRHGGQLRTNFSANNMCQRYLDNMWPIYADVYSNQPDPLPEKFVRQSMQLGMVVGHELLAPRYMGPRIRSLRDHTDSPEAFYTYISGSSLDFLFLSERDSLQDLLCRYAETFTSTEEDHFRAINIGAITLQHIEERHYANFCNTEAAKLYHAVNAFNGEDLSKLD